MEKLNGTVVLADDEASYRILWKKIVKGLGLEVVGEASNGQEAVDLYKKLQPDLLLLDVNMPIKNGQDALKEICSEFPGAFVVMMTAQRESGVISDCFVYGAADYIPKDRDINEIRKALLEIWEKVKGK
jgi:two-component system chemotaxis response regulator CheY